MIEVKNITQGLVMLGENYLLPGQTRRARPYQYQRAVATYGPEALLVNPTTIPDALDGYEYEPVDSDLGDDEELEDVIEVEVDVEISIPADLPTLKRAELVDLAERLGLDIEGRPTKAELIQLIADGYTN